LREFLELQNKAAARSIRAVNKNIRRILNAEQKVHFRLASVAIRQDMACG
jgi:hypothetical protein